MLTVGLSRVMLLSHQELLTGPNLAEVVAKPMLWPCYGWWDWLFRGGPKHR